MLSHIILTAYENSAQIFEADPLRPLFLSGVTDDFNGAFRMCDDSRRHAAKQEPVENSESACAEENCFGAPCFRVGEERGSRIAFHYFGIHG